MTRKNIENKTTCKTFVKGNSYFKESFGRGVFGYKQNVFANFRTSNFQSN